MKTLHSTMFIFISQAVRLFTTRVFDFTFHYVYIYIWNHNSLWRKWNNFTFHYVYIYIRQGIVFEYFREVFTFHYVYIYIMPLFTAHIHHTALHSTMFIFIFYVQQKVSGKNLLYIPLCLYLYCIFLGWWRVETWLYIPLCLYLYFMQIGRAHVWTPVT